MLLLAGPGVARSVSAPSPLVLLPSDGRARGAASRGTMLAIVPPTFLSASPQPNTRTTAASVKTCDVLQWGAISTEVCASSEIGHECSGRKKYADAKSFCHNVGARVCSYEELLNDAAKESGCSLDDARVWTSTPCVKGDQAGLYTGAGSYDYEAAHARHCVIVDSSATTLLPVRCCADGREAQSWPVKPTAVRAATPHGQLRTSLIWGCDTLRVQVEAVPAPDQVAVFVAAATNARPPDSPLLPSWDGSVTIGTTGSFDVTKLLPNTSYSMWSSVHSARGWSNWSAPRRASTTRPTEMPPPPQAPEMGAATSCDEMLLRLPAKADAGCASYESLELEMMVTGQGWQAAAYKKRADRTVSVSQLDPLRVVEYRFAAKNLAGRSLGESTGPLPGMGVVSRDGLLSPPAVSATSSQSMHLDWSAMAPLGCSSLLTWQVLHRRNGAAGDAWQVLERSHPHTIYQPVIRCAEGCSFKVLPNLVGWTQPSVASVPVPTPEMPPLPPTPGARLRLRLQPEAHEIEPFKLVFKLLCTELKEALGATGPQVVAVELVDGEQSIDAVIDLLPSADPTSRSPAALAQEMVSLLGGELQKGYVGQYLIGSHGAWRIFESEGKVTEQLLSAGSESLLSPAADIDDRSSLPPGPVNESAQLVLGLAILGLAAAVVLGLVRRRCSTQYRTVSSRTEAVGLPTDDERDSEEPEYL